MRTRLFFMLPLICAPLAFWACGGDSGTSAKDDESSSSVAEKESSSSSVILSGDSAGVDIESSGSSISYEFLSSPVEESSSSAKSSGSVVKSSSSSAKESSSSDAISSSSDVILNSSSNVIPSDVEKSSGSVANSSSVESSSSKKHSSSSAGASSSEVSSSSEKRTPIPYTTKCPAGKTCTYAPTEQLNPEITYGEFLDTRDYQMYKTVIIGTQTWMAQNLNYAYMQSTAELDSSSFCNEEASDFCAKYGRLYLWSAVIDSTALANDATNPQTCGYMKKCDRLTEVALAMKSIQGVCPGGWHVPSVADLEVMREAKSGECSEQSCFSEALKSSFGWGDYNGIDRYGFSALPAGVLIRENLTANVGSLVFFWLANQHEENESSASSWTLADVHGNDALPIYSSKNYGLSVRCLKD